MGHRKHLFFEESSRAMPSRHSRRALLAFAEEYDYLLTDGGPNGATLFLPVYIFDQAFEFLGFGYGATLTLVLLAITTALVGAVVWLGWRWYGRQR
jgi:ABC-type sugar transport system permease subunit